MRVCDWCNKKLQGCAVKVIGSWPSAILDGEEYEFCSDRCAIAGLGKWFAKPWGEKLKKMEEEIEMRKRFEVESK